MTPVIVVHGGAGRISDGLDAAALAGVAAAAAAGQSVLVDGGSAEDAVVVAVRVMEDDPVFNAGRGSCMTDIGTFEADAGIMRSRDLGSGAIAAVPDLADAILVAQAVMQHGRHRVLAGQGAVDHASKHGVGVFSREACWSEKAQRRFDRANADTRDGQADTVGAVAIDTHGHLCAGSSTGGVLFKRPGRVGDSPLCGAGFYAAPHLGAATATGMGEAILTHVASFDVLQRISAGQDPVTAARNVCQTVAEKHDATCGLILITPAGRPALAHASPHMSWARAMGSKPVEAGLRYPDIAI